MQLGPVLINALRSVGLSATRVHECCGNLGSRCVVSQRPVNDVESADVEFAVPQSPRLLHGQFRSDSATQRFLLTRFGLIDRSIQDVSSRPDLLCTFVTLDS
jgi:hypothetical protein